MALFSVFLASLLRLGMNALVGDRFPFLPFFVAVLVSSSYGGLRPGLVSILLSLLAVNFFVMEPVLTLHVLSSDDIVGMGMFIVVAGIVALIADQRRTAQMDAERSADLARRANEALRESQQQLTLALDAARMGTWDWNVVTGALNWSPQLEGIHGMAPGTFDGTFESFVGVVHPEDRDDLSAAIAHALESGTEFETHFRVVHQDGSHHWVAGEGSVIRDEGGRPIRMVGVGMDITARKQAELELMARAEREAILNRITQAFRSTTDPDWIQTTAAQSLGQALQADRCFLAHYNAARDLVTVGGDWHRPDLPSLTGTYHLRDFHLRWEELYPENEPLVLSDIPSSALSEEAIKALGAFGTRSVLSVGLFEESGVLVASLNVLMVDTAREWTAWETALVQTVAAQIRSAIETAQVRDRERRIAERLQEALLPTPPEQIGGLDIKEYYQPALEGGRIGGDFYDVFPLREDQYALVVADLSGKGLDAAAQVATVRYMLRALLYVLPGVEEAVTELNSLLSRQRLLTGFATLFVGIYKGGTRRLSYVSCGQEPGLLWRVASRQVEQLPPTGPVLGAFPTAHYSSVELELLPGDILTIFTDGLTEAGPDRQHLLGITGVSALLEAEAPEAPDASTLARRLVSRILSRADSGIQDDTCLLAVRVTHSEEPPGNRDA